MKTKLYIPNPRLCFKCQKFGHGKNTCRGQTTCSNCGLKNHTKDHCDQEVCCPNCNGDHPAESKQCPKYKEQKEILKIQFTNNITFFEAKKRYENLYSPLLKAVTTGNTQTFSSAVTSTNIIKKKDLDIKKLTEENNIMKTEIASLRKELFQLKSIVSASNEVSNTKKRSHSDRDDCPSPTPGEHVSKQKPRLETSYEDLTPTGAESSYSMEVETSMESEASPAHSSENAASVEAAVCVSSETLQSHPVTDSDGFTTVQSQRRRRSVGRKESAEGEKLSGGTRGSFVGVASLSPSRQRSQSHGEARSRSNSRSRSPRDRSLANTAVQHPGSRQKPFKSQKEGKPEVPPKPSSTIQTSNRYITITPP